MPARNSLLDLQRSSHRITLYFSLISSAWNRSENRQRRVIRCSLADPGRHLRHGDSAQRSRLGKGAWRTYCSRS